MRGPAPRGCSASLRWQASRSAEVSRRKSSWLQPMAARTAPRESPPERSCAGLGWPGAAAKPGGPASPLAGVVARPEGEGGAGGEGAGRWTTGGEMGAAASRVWTAGTGGCARVSRSVRRLAALAADGARSGRTGRRSRVTSGAKSMLGSLNAGVVQASRTKARAWAAIARAMAVARCLSLRRLRSPVRDKPACAPTFDNARSSALCGASVAANDHGAVYERSTPRRSALSIRSLSRKLRVFEPGSASRKRNSVAGQGDRGF